MGDKKKDPVLAGTGTLSVPIHEFKGLRTLEGEPLDAAALRGKAVLITNVSSKCGYTKMNYEGLNRLHDEFKGKLEVVGVPCNQVRRGRARSRGLATDATRCERGTAARPRAPAPVAARLGDGAQFGEQEPGTPAEIREFVRTNFKSTFPLTQKCDVNGPRTHPLYVELKRATGTEDKDVRWNFESKFIVAKDGVSVSRYVKAFDPDKIRAQVAAAAAGAPAPRL